MRVLRGLFLRDVWRVDHALEIDHDDWFVSNDPRIMSCSTNDISPVRHPSRYRHSSRCGGRRIRDIESGSLAASVFAIVSRVDHSIRVRTWLGLQLLRLSYKSICLSRTCDLVWRIEMFNFHLGEGMVSPSRFRIIRLSK